MSITVPVTERFVANLKVLHCFQAQFSMVLGRYLETSQYNRTIRMRWVLEGNKPALLALV